MAARWIRACLTLVALALSAAPATAQYFGRQKVQYETFDWRVLQTDHFKIHFYEDMDVIAHDAARMSERWYTRLSFAFQHEFDEKPLIFYSDHPDFQQTNVIGGALTEGTGGVTESLKNRVIMPFTGVYDDNDHVLGHELVHVFQYDVAQSSPQGMQGLAALPLWLIEGMAEYLSLGREDPHTAMWLRDAALRGELPTIEQLGRDSRFFPYRYGQALWAYIAGRWGDRAVPELYRFAVRAGWEPALQRVLGATSEQISQDWIESIRATYLPVIQGRQRPEDAGVPILAEADEIGAMNISPVVSPDGNRVAFFGRRDLFTVDLYLADARTGEIIRRLASPQRDAHIDALSFIQTAGAFSPDGRQFIYITFEEGDNRLQIVDVASGDTQREIEVPDVGAISNPAWSPDGRSIAFTGIRGGIGDLYIYDLQTRQTRQLTDDRFANMHPTWSPDGGTIAFATDQGPETSFDRLVYGEMNLALYDVASGATRVLELFENTKHINPQYSPDGTSLFFVADRDGFSDVYRLDLATNEISQVTRVATGISGIVALAPAMSIAQQDGRMLFSIFYNSGQHIHGIEASETAGTPLAPAQPTTVARMLPPLEAAQTGIVHDYLTDPLRGLPPASTQFAISDYDPGLSLDFIGPPSFGVSTSSFGTGVAGGVSAFFSDMLGDHQVGAVLQAQGELKDIGGQAMYMNAKRRLNYGAMVGHIPYLTGYRPALIDNNDGTFTLEQIFERIYIDQALALGRYPLSQTRRFEANAGYTRYGFDREVWRALYNSAGQQLTEVQRSDVDSPDALHFFEASAAYVGDNSYFGFTAPIAGERFRFEVSPTFGTLQYTTALADYRRYFWLRPLTLAMRGMHVGRYGEGAEGVTDNNQRVLSPLFLGWETLVRGYAQESIGIDECRPVEGNTCPVFNRLIGSRMAVANLELRFPLLGVSEISLIEFPFVPVDIGGFVDAGVAWTADESPVLEFQRTGAERVPVVSTGFSARANVLGFLIIEAYYAYPFQRPDEGWHWGFNLAPGW